MAFFALLAGWAYAGRAEQCRDLVAYLSGGQYTNADDQFRAATLMSHCQGYDFWPYTASQTEDIQHVLEYASSQSLKPGALLAMVRRMSSFGDACQTGVRYLESASAFTAKV